MRLTLPKAGTKKLHLYLIKNPVYKKLKIGRDALHKILKNNNLLIKKMKKYHITTNSKHQFYKFDNLIKNYSVSAPEQVFVADITYIDCKEKNLYLHLVTDLYSKKIMGYELSDNLKAESSLKALKMAVKNKQYPTLPIHHSDRGIQYCSNLYTEFAQQNQIKMSMTNNGDPYENAVAERINRTLKEEFGLGKTFVNQTLAQKVTKQAVQVYNNIRIHYSCNMQTPNLTHKKANIKYKSWSKNLNLSLNEFSS